RCAGSLVIVGEGPLDGPLRSLVAEKRIGDRVLFAGHVLDADLPAFYQACDVFVLPSIARTEAFGVVQIEAMAAGRPVVSTNLPTGVPWVNRDGVSGLVVAPDNADALGAALAELGQDEALRARLADGARRRADARFTRVGRILRATAMDELPQLWNIFRGDMSFVGPRALRPEEIDVDGAGASIALEAIPGFAERVSVQPGLTGIAQIYAPRDVSRRQKFRFDRLYIKRQSLLLDVRLIALSFWITFRGTWETREKKF